MTKFCKDCRFCRFADGNGATCVAPQNLITKLDLVTGEQVRVRKYDYCSTLRMAGVDGDCGPDANWFEPKETELEQAHG